LSFPGQGLTFFNINPPSGENKRIQHALAGCQGAAGAGISPAV
jgi:hypothetical protein